MLSAWQWRRAENHRAEAEDNFHLAHGAVQRFHEILFEEEAFDAPGFFPLRQEVLEQALPYDDRLLAKRVESPTIRADLADAYYHLAHIAHSRGSREKAVELYRKSAVLREGLAAEEPQTWEHCYFWAKLLRQIAEILYQDQDSREALPLLSDALELHEELVSERPREARMRIELAQTLIVLIECQLSRTESRDAAPHAARILAVLLELPRRCGTPPDDYERWLAQAYAAALGRHIELSRPRRLVAATPWHR